MNLKIFVVAGALALSGCATVSDGPVAVDNSTITQIQSAARSICSFVPTVSTVVGLVVTFTGGGTTVGLIERVANAICSAMTAKALRKGAAAPRINGVPIRGHFVGR